MGFIILEKDGKSFFLNFCIVLGLNKLFKVSEELVKKLFILLFY